MPEWLKSQIDSLDDLPESIDPRDLFSRDGEDGPFRLASVAGLAPAEDLDKVRRSLAGARSDESKAREQLKRWSELGDLDEVQGQLARLPELEALAEGKTADLEKASEAKVRRIQAEAEAARKKIEAERDTLAEKVEAFELKERNRIIRDSLRDAAVKAKVRTTALEDVLLRSSWFEIDDEGTPVTKPDLGGVPAGLTAEALMSEMKERAPHWWEASMGGGAGGGGGGDVGGDNPWSPKTMNVTEQARMVKSNPDRARRLWQAAGKPRNGIVPQ